MPPSCPVPTSAERHYIEIQERAEQTMLAAIYGALRTASDQAADELKAIGAELPPPDHDYFVAVAQQKLFLMLCGADPETFEGGNPDIATAVLRNGQNILDHYWSKGFTKTAG